MYIRDTRFSLTRVPLYRRANIVEFSNNFKKYIYIYIYVCIMHKQIKKTKTISHSFSGKIDRDY